MIPLTLAIMLTVCLISATAAPAPAPSALSAPLPGPGPYTRATYPPIGSPPLTSPQLRFDDKGEFHIMQIADIHYVNGTAPCMNVLAEHKATCSDTNSTTFMAEVLNREKPNLAIYTGDQLYHDEVLASTGTNLSAAQVAVLKPTIDAGVPFMSTYGNHDCEKTDCRDTLMAAEQQSSPLSLSQYGPTGIKGTGTYAYVISGRDGQPAWAIYVIDGGAYIGFGGDNKTGDVPADGLWDGYDYINAAQVDWYNKTSMALEKEAGRKVPAVLFTHIPLPEYNIAYTCGNKEKRLGDMSIADFTTAPPGCDTFGQANTTAECQAAYAFPLPATENGAGYRLPKGKGCDNANTVGNQYEGIYSAHVNGGLFAAMVQRGDVKLVSVGHDHVNDYCASLMGIRLCYGGGFGYHAYGLAGWPRRSRQIVLSEDGSTIRTWKRLGDLGNYATVDLETFATGTVNNITSYTPGNPADSSNFTSSTVLGCGKFGQCNGTVSGLATFNVSSI